MTFLTILRRELRSLIASPQTYFIAAGYFVISGIFFVNLLVTTQVPDLQRYYNNAATTLVVLVPISAMRSFAEERKAGALNLTLSWPLSRTGIVLGKFAANTLYTWALISVVWLYTRILAGLAAIADGSGLRWFRPAARSVDPRIRPRLDRIGPAVSGALGAVRVLSPGRALPPRRHLLPHGHRRGAHACGPGPGAEPAGPDASFAPPTGCRAGRRRGAGHGNAGAGQTGGR